ncbi:3-isopropylmalate dehydratase small subunit [Desulfogranum japonicum]|uniref:3-isopropylmalate dehydratase small subunit n=1 Tax=Desulfogranum japonicum TaxID=231447 RepID=UPI0003FC483E|nr:3-isopropylmalate dehydratase small subunit [Desulfogranum japonicum]
MEPFHVHTGIVAPMDRANVDTDLIIPKQFLKSIKRTGFGPNLFDALRYLDEGQPGMDNSARPRNPDLMLNQDRYQNATILLTRGNFGCGSSREHAPWALLDYGFKVLLAPSFADIFYNNCFKNGILPILQENSVIEQLFTAMYAEPGFTLTVDLEKQVIIMRDGQTREFDVDPFRKECLLNGLDDIGITLRDQDKILAYEEQRRHITPWIFSEV